MFTLAGGDWGLGALFQPSLIQLAMARQAGEKPKEKIQLILPAAPKLFSEGW
jgi:hypothetical protein